MEFTFINFGQFPCSWMRICMPTLLRIRGANSIRIRIHNTGLSPAPPPPFFLIHEGCLTWEPPWQGRCREGSGLDGPDPRDRRSRIPHPRLQFLFSILSHLMHCKPGVEDKGTAYCKGMVPNKMSQRADLNVAQTSLKLKPPCFCGELDWKLVCRKNNLLTLFTIF